MSVQLLGNIFLEFIYLIAQSKNIWPEMNIPLDNNIDMEEFLKLFLGVTINPFLPTGQFLAPKLIILIKCLIKYFILPSVVLMFLYVEQDVNLA